MDYPEHFRRLLTPSLGMRWVWMIWTLWMATSWTSVPADPVGGRRIIRHWNVDDGLPHNYVEDMVRGPAGKLWIATRSGIVRFDGKQFSTQNVPGIAGVRCGQIQFDISGACWAETSAGLRWLAPPSLISAEERSDILQEGVYDLMTRDGEGTLWVLTRGTHGKVRGWSHQVRPEIPKGTNDPPWNEVQTIFPAVKHGIWMVTSFGALWKGGTNGWVQRTADLPGNRILDWYQALELEDGRIWLSWTSHPQGSGFAFWDGARWQIQESRVASENGTVFRMVPHPKGGILAGTTDGRILELDQDLNRPRIHQVTNNQVITAIVVDSANHWWVGTSGGGVFLLTEDRGTLIQTRPERPARALSTTTDGSLWVANHLNGLAQIRNGVLVRPNPLPSGLFPQGSYVNAVLAEGNLLWVGGSGFLSLLDPTKGFLWQSERPSGNGSVLSLCSAEDGGIWAGLSDSAILHVSHPDRHLTRISLPNPGRVHGMSRHGNEIWVASESGLHCWTGKQWKKLPEALNSLGGARCVLVDSGGMVLAGMDQGLWIDDGDHQVVATVESGLPSFPIQQIVADAQENIWLGSPRGLTKIVAAEIAQFLQPTDHSLSVHHQDQLSGLPSERCTFGAGPGATLLPDGHLAFCMEDGVLLVDPTQPTPPPPQPNTHLTHLEVDGIIIPGKGIPAMPEFLRPQSLRLKFSITSLERLGRVEFRHRLIGDSDSWTYNSDADEILIRNPQPGIGGFELEILDPSGNWVRALHQGWRILPRWWEDVTVRVGGGLALALLPAGGLFLIQRQRQKRQAEQQRHLNRLHEERARIARDLHDDLGNRMSELQLICERLAAAEASSEITRTYAERLKDRILESLSALDDTVWLLRPAAETLDRVASTLQSITERYLETSGIRLSFQVTGLQEYLIPSFLRQALALTLKELLRNIVRHSHAKHVEVLLSQKDGHLILRVSDDGQGLDLKKARSLGRGLVHMSRRVEELHGSLDIQSGPGRTCITLTLPAPSTAIPPTSAHV